MTTESTIIKTATRHHEQHVVSGDIPAGTLRLTSSQLYRAGESFDWEARRIRVEWSRGYADEPWKVGVAVTGFRLKANGDVGLRNVSTFWRAEGVPTDAAMPIELNGHNGVAVPDRVAEFVAVNHPNLHPRVGG